jgi:hypothetical protein
VGLGEGGAVGVAEGETLGLGDGDGDVDAVGAGDPLGVGRGATSDPVTFTVRDPGVHHDPAWMKKVSPASASTSTLDSPPIASGSSSLQATSTSVASDVPV